MHENAQRVHTVIEAGRSQLLKKIKNIILFRDLFVIFVVKDVKVRYKQTMLGFTWALIQPLVSVLVFTIIFGRLAKMDTNGVPYPLFNYLAMVPWSYFSSSFSAATISLVGNAMISKVFFPRILIPLAPILGNLVDFSISLGLVLGFLIYYKVMPGPNLIFLPLLIVILFLFVSGLSSLLSAMAIQFRDIKFGLPFLTQILMYGAPVVWSATKVPEAYRTLYGLYPMAGVIEGFRACFIPDSQMPWDLIFPGSISACAFFVTGFLFFHNREKIFADIF